MKRSALCVGLWAALMFVSPAFAIGSNFSYQGALQDAGVVANGSYDLEFRLQTQAGVPVGSPVVKDNVAVAQGVFSVELDFGPVISTADYQLQIGVRAGASVGAFTALTPATKITATPQAQVATIAAEAVTVSAGSVTSAGIADGSVGTADINSTQVQRRIAASCASGQSIRVVAVDGTVTCEAAGSGPPGPPGPAGEIGATGPQGAPGSADAWSRVGNAGTNSATDFIGTSDNVAFVVRANNAPVALFRPDANAATNVVLASGNTIEADGVYHSVISGGKQNTIELGLNAVSIFGATISGGDSNYAGEAYATVSGGTSNYATEYMSTVGGGSENEAAAYGATVAGGELNQATGNGSTISGGKDNKASAWYATVSGGDYNSAYGYRSSIVGGYYNHTSGYASTVSGGYFNCAGGNYSWAGGQRATVRGSLNNVNGCYPDSGDADGDEGTFVWADAEDAPFESSGENQFLVRAGGGVGINATPAVSDTVLIKSNSLQENAKLRLVSQTAGNEATFSLEDISGNTQVMSKTGDLLLDTFAANKYIYTNDRFGVGRRPLTNKLEVNGDASKITAGNWLANSDRRIKTDIEPIAGALETILKLRPVSFRYDAAYRAENSEIVDVRYYNVIAQEFAEVFPDAVKGSGAFLPGKPQTAENEILQVDTYPAQIVTLAAIQELAIENQALKARLAILEAKMAKM